jgi:hypothetical protein
VDELTGGVGKFESGLVLFGATAADEVGDAEALEDAAEPFFPPAATATPGPTRARDMDASRAAAPLRRRINRRLEPTAPTSATSSGSPL